MRLASLLGELHLKVALPTAGGSLIIEEVMAPSAANAILELWFGPSLRRERLLAAKAKGVRPGLKRRMTLFARVFRIDISVCARCSGPMRVTRAFTRPEDIAAELHGARPPPRGPAPGQLLLFSAPP